MVNKVAVRWIEIGVSGLVRVCLDARSVAVEEPS
jgi:hypothetical protein